MAQELVDLPEVYQSLQITYDGGSDEEREQVLKVYHTFMHANETLDYELLCTIWDDNSDNLFFNTNGHTYEGLKDWENIWNFYRPQFKWLAPYGPGRIHVTIGDGVACVAADSISRFKEWVGRTTEHNPPHYRATKVMVRRGDEWRVVHSHFSVQGEGPRPDQAQ